MFSDLSLKWNGSEVYHFQLHEQVPNDWKKLIKKATLGRLSCDVRYWLSRLISA